MKRGRFQEDCSLCDKTSFMQCTYCKVAYCRDHFFGQMVCGIKQFLSSDHAVCKSCLFEMKLQIIKEINFLDELEMENLTEKLDELKR